MAVAAGEGEEEEGKDGAIGGLLLLLPSCSQLVIQGGHCLSRKTDVNATPAPAPDVLPALDGAVPAPASDVPPLPDVLPRPDVLALPPPSFSAGYSASAPPASVKLICQRERTMKTCGEKEGGEGYFDRLG